MKFLARFLALAGILPIVAAAAFIQDPVPPSEARNFFLDKDLDGKMDRVEIVFLGNLSRNYLDSTVAGLSFVFPDSAGKLRTFSYAGHELPFDSLRPNTVSIDLSADRNISSRTTALSSATKAATVRFADQSRMAIEMRERIAPQILAATFFALDRETGDSLVILFSEPVEEILPGSRFLELRRNGSFQELSVADARWNAERTVAAFLFPKESGAVLSGDSVRILAKALRDSSKNIVPENSPQTEIRTFSSFRLRSNSLATLSPEDPSPKPVFELRFSDPSETFDPGDLGIAIDFGKGDLRPSADRESLSLAAALQIYTASGEFVTGVHFEVKCSDKRFPEGDCIEHPQRVFLKWNLMSSDRKLAGTGAYLAKVTAIVRSHDAPIWQKSEVQSWGIRRMSHGRP